MSIETVADRAAFFNKAEHGTEVTYTPISGGAQRTVTVIFDNPDALLDLGTAGVAAVAARALVNLDDLLAAPAKGDTFGIPGGSTWAIRRVVADPERKIFTLDLDPV